jgi:hypothetical protein
VDRRSLRRARSPGLIEIVIGPSKGWGRIWSACCLRSSRGGKDKVGSQPEEQSLLEASFPREMGGHTLFQKGSKRKGFREPVPLRSHLGVTCGRHN